MKRVIVVAAALVLSACGRDHATAPLHAVQPSTPMLVVDGKKMDSAALGTLKANDIESIEILKGSAAASLYGKQAATHGVILVTTKPKR